MTNPAESRRIMAGGMQVTSSLFTIQKMALLSLALFATLLVPGGGVFAQEKRAAVGAGVEWNMNSREHFAGGAALGFNYSLPYAFAAGLSVSGSTNFFGIAVVETSALLRRYFPGTRHDGFFAQADAGLFLVLEDGEAIPMFLGGLRAGYRLPLGSSWYIEPYSRFGYPFVFGIGVSGGLKL